jgi:hypothetical protein
MLAEVGPLEPRATTDAQKHAPHKNTRRKNFDAPTERAFAEAAGVACDNNEGDVNSKHARVYRGAFDTRTTGKTPQREGWKGARGGAIAPHVK